MIKDIENIISELHEIDWTNPPIAVLVEKQGRLATYLYTIGSLLQEAKYEKSCAEIAYKKEEAEAYLSYRENGESIKDAEMSTRKDLFEAHMAILEADKKFSELRQIIESTNVMIISCQSAIREGRRQFVTSQL